MRVVTGLRPYRPTGFVLRAEAFGDKTLIHNYGHGGGGITLSWGTSQWSPASFFDEDAVDEGFYNTLGIAMRHSYNEFQNLVGPHYGVRWVSNYLLSDSPIRDSDMRLRYPDMFPELRSMSPREHPFPATHALHFDTMFIEPPVYLPAIMRDFRIAGGRINVRAFAAELHTLDEPVIVNCTGLGSYSLFDDKEMFPVKGQLVVLKPEADINYLMINRGFYMFPRQDGVLLGGTFDKHDWSLEADPAETARILEQHAGFFRDMEDPWETG